jgi:putative ABC transport system permease protein
VQSLLALAAVTVAFVLHGLAFGVAEGFRQSALERGIPTPPSVNLVAVGVSTVGMLLILLLTTSAMAHSVRARTHELALLKALGFAKRRIVSLLIAEAAVPCLSGAVLGLMGAKALFFASAKVMAPLAIVPAPIYTFNFIMLSLAIAIAVATLTAMLPSARVARLDVATLFRSTPSLRSPALRDAQVKTSDETADRSTQALPKARKADEASDRRLLRQIVVATRIGLSTLPMRKSGALLVVGSVAAVVFVMLSMLSMAEGIRVGILNSGDPTRVLLRPASSVLLNKRLPEGVAALLTGAPGIAKASNGLPLIGTELFSGIGKLAKRNNGESGYTILAGVGPLWREMTPTFQLLSGRLPTPGRREIIAGRLAAGKFSSLDEGTVRHLDQTWRVVGTFATGTWWDGYLVTTSGDLASATTEPTGSVVRARLTSADAFAILEEEVRPRLPPTVVLERETDFYAAFWRRVPKHLIYITFVLSGLLSSGAALGATLVMHNVMEDRNREIATLRLFGFGAAATAASVFFEGLTLCLLGAAVGTAIVWSCFDGFLYNGAWGIYRVTVDGVLLLLAVGWGCGIAVAGAVPFTLRTMRRTALDEIRTLFAAS